MVKKYKRKPEVIEAVQFTGDNLSEVVDFVGRYNTYFATKDFIDILSFGDSRVRVHLTDFIIKDKDGGFSPCSSWLFYNYYEYEEV